MKNSWISSKEKPILVLNPGWQYAKKLDSLIRDIGYRTEFIMMNGMDLTLEQVEEKYSAIIIAWSGSGVNDDTSPRASFDLLKTALPIFGVCYGFQLLNYLAWGTVESSWKREDGVDMVRVDLNSILFHWLNDMAQKVLMTHGDSVTQIANWFTQIATSSSGVVAWIEDTSQKIHAVQFHPESDETINGSKMIQNFLSHYWIDADFTQEDKETLALQEIQEKVGSKDVLVYASGWVDSTVLVVLLLKAVKLWYIRKEQLKVVHVDHGFMRAGEREEVEEAFKKLGVDLHVSDAKNYFYNATTIINWVKTPPLHQVTDPEVKRKIIGDCFINMKAEIEKNLSLNPKNTILAQWTLWTDIVESREWIKTHHNDSPLVHELRNIWNVIEPLSEYHKHEVRALWRKLGLPESMVMRHPFPWPGLAIRLLCHTGEMSSFERGQFAKVKARLEEVLPILQSSFPAGTEVHITPIKTTWVQGDARSYKYMSVIKVSDKESLKPEVFAEISKLITDAVSIPLLDENGEQVYQVIKAKKKWESDKKIALTDGINRVVLDTSDDEIINQNISLTPTYIWEDSVEQLRKADDIVNGILRKYGLMGKIDQVPIVSLPIDFSPNQWSRTIVIRTLITKDFLTWTVALPWEQKDMTWNILEEMKREILFNVSWITRVLYDITWKPPATTEYE